MKKTRVKCDCCRQTQFFRDQDTIYIKCPRCKNERAVKLADIATSSSELSI
jgi:Zn finger protein HypA/HybF involved in hydrogenase expression